MKMRTEKFKDKFLEKFDPCYFGIYALGMTNDEIFKYLSFVNKEVKKFKSNRALKVRFNKIAGINTCGVVSCPKCGEQFSVMYRHDVERFTRQLFFGTPTYFD